MKKKRVGCQPKRQAVLDRRGFLAGAGALTLSAVTARRLHGMNTSRQYRVAVIGHTGRGNYGHGLDRVWLEVPGVQIVGVADANPQGLAQAVKRLGGPKGYADYRRMLEELKPDLVSVGVRWLDQHRDMVVAAAERGVRGIYLEKPMCRTMAEADQMIAACRKHGVKLALAVQTRYSPKLPVIRELIRSGTIGRVLELRGRGAEDPRGGGEDLWVFGTHVMNLFHYFGGEAKCCFADLRQNGRPVRRQDVKPGGEGIGPLAGDEVHAMYRLAEGTTAYFDSVRNTAGRPTRFGVWIYGSKGMIHVHTGYLPDAYLLPVSSWSSGRSGTKSIPISSAGVGKPEPLADCDWDSGNVLPAKDLISAVEEDRQPLAGIDAARTATEMIVAVFESHRVGGPVKLPLENRENPLTMLL